MLFFVLSILLKILRCLLRFHFIKYDWCCRNLNKKGLKLFCDYELKNYTTKIRFTIKMPQFFKDQRLSSSQKATVMLHGTPCNLGYMIWLGYCLV